MKLRSVFCIIACGFIFLYGCSSSKEYEEESESKLEEKIYERISKAVGYQILKAAKEEQLNQMYSPSVDSTYLFWLNDELIILHNSSKCNIYALNVLHKAGFKCPHENALTYDLMDTGKFNDVFPFIKINSPDDIVKGDLIIWNGHIIIYDSSIYINDKLYAIAWWAGTSQQNNGENVINNVVHGKYPLQGFYIVRRPLKRR